MKSTRSYRQGSRRDRRGVTIVVITLLMTIIVAMVAFSIEVGRIALLRGELQNAVDAGALAASLRMRQDSGDLDRALASAREFVQRNKVGSGRTIPDHAIEVEVGQWDSDTKSFVGTLDSPNAVRVFARQVDPYLFGRIFGLLSLDAPGQAIASGSERPLDIMMVLDLSGSMAWQGRIEALWNSAPSFVDVIEELSDGQEDLIGVMGLATDPSGYDPVAEGDSGVVYNSGLHPTNDHYAGVLEATLTSNFNYLRDTVLSSSNMEAGKYTNYTGTGAAMADAAHYLVNGAEARFGEDVERIIVLLSDGQANRPTGNGSGYALQMATYCADNDVTVYTISLGNGADVDLMQSIADYTGGAHFDSTGYGEAELSARLRDAFMQIANTIKRSQLVQ